PNRWTLQQALQQLCVLLILRLRSRHTLSVEAQLADHFGLGLHPIDFNAQHLFRSIPQAPATLFAEDLCRCPEGEKEASAETHRGFCLACYLVWTVRNSANSVELLIFVTNHGSGPILVVTCSWIALPIGVGPKAIE